MTARATGSNGGGCAAAVRLRVPRAWYGATPPASRLLRIADATALRAGPDPGDLCGPSGRKNGQATPAPRSARGTPRCPLAAQDHHNESLHCSRGLTFREKAKAALQDTSVRERQDWSGVEAIVEGILGVFG